MKNLEHEWPLLEKLVDARLHRVAVQQGWYSQKLTVKEAIERLKEIEQTERILTCIKLLREFEPEDDFNQIIANIISYVVPSRRF